MNMRFKRVENAMNSRIVKDERAAMNPKAIAGLLVSALLITTIGYQALGYLFNTTLMTNNGITGTNQTLMLVVGLMVIVSIVMKFVPKGR